MATIHLDTPLPGASSGLPAGSGEQPSNACAVAPPCDLLDLASGGVCQAIPVTRDAGALLPHRFTLTIAGGLFSVALSRESPRIAVSNHPALRSPDFPRLTSGSHPPSRPAVIRGRPANSFAQIKVPACATLRPAPGRPVETDVHSGADECVVPAKGAPGLVQRTLFRCRQKHNSFRNQTHPPQKDK